MPSLYGRGATLGFFAGLHGCTILELHRCGAASKSRADVTMNRTIVRSSLELLISLALLVLGITVLFPTRASSQSARPQFPDPGTTRISREDQRAYGRQAAAEVYKFMPILPDNSPETEYVRQLGQKLVATIPPQYSWPFEFHVIAQKEINAFALPGGPMFINIGTITAAANEAQLAGVMAHEMSHVYMQHSAKQAGKAQTTGLLAGIAGAVLGGVGGAAGALGQMGIGMTAQGIMLKYSRGDEARADAVGAVILYKAGYNPQAMADFFRTLESEGSGGRPPQWLSDHPDPGTRQAAIEREIRNWPRQNYAADSAAFRAARQHASGVKAYSGEEIAEGARSGRWAALNKENGATFNSNNAGAVSTRGSTPARSSPARAVQLEAVLPSQRMLVADLAILKIAHPENWRVFMPEPPAQFITIAPPAGKTENGVGYGIVIDQIPRTSADSTNLDQVTRAIVSQMQQNDGVEPVGGPQPITVAGIQGRSNTLVSTSPFSAPDGTSQKEQDWLVVVPQRDRSIIFMVFVAPQPQFDLFRRTFEAMLATAQF